MNIGKNSYIWRTRQVIWETSDTVTIVFDTDQPFDYEPGQFVNISLPVNAETVTRSYSLSSLPTDAYPAITVKRVSGGRMSNYILDNAQHIKEWKADGPHGSFVPLATSYQCRQIVLLAGGSGITPLFSIARSVMERSPDTVVTLIYSVHSKDDIIFQSVIEAWQQQYKNRFNVVYAVSQPAPAGNPLPEPFIKGRINRLSAMSLIKQYVPDPASAVQYFICGPVELMNMYRELLIAMQIPADNIFMEWFAVKEQSNEVILPATEQEVLLHYYEQTNLLDVKPGQSILEAALEDRIPLPYSCKRGTCGRCVAKLLEGEVTMINNYSLQKTDVDNRLILLCQSYPVNNEVTVEIG